MYLRKHGINFLLRSGVLVLDLFLLPLQRLGFLSPRYRFWESLRTFSSGFLASVDEGAGPRQVREEEFVGKFEVDVGELEECLYEQGFVRNPLSRLKKKEEHIEEGSWVLRDSIFSRRQLHLMLFDIDGLVEVYAHEEYSSEDPLVAVEHYKGETQHMQKGVEEAMKYLPRDKKV